MKQKRLKPEIRKEEILAAALVLAGQQGYTQITRDEIAKHTGVSGPAVQYHFGTMAQLRTELMRYAVKTRNAIVVAQGLAVRDRQAMKADEALRHEARRAIL